MSTLRNESLLDVSIEEYKMEMRTNENNLCHLLDKITIAQDRQGLANKSTNVNDEDYEKFQTEWKKLGNVKFVKVKEESRDLFTMSNDYSLAHCVAEDMRMGYGIGVQFKKKFKSIDELLQQNVKQGGVAFLKLDVDNHNRYIYYLVIKRVSHEKSTYATIWSCLKKLRDHVKDNKVKKLALPRIGCGLNKMEWNKVKPMIEFLFRNVDVEIVVCNYRQEGQRPKKDNVLCKVVHERNNVVNIEARTIIIYLSSEDGHFTDEMNNLAKKFNFKPQFQEARKRLGGLIRFKTKKYILYGCIARKTAKSNFDFVSFKKCLLQIDKNNKKDKYKYVSIQAIEDEMDPTINEKIITVMRSYLKHVFVWVCWSGVLSSKMPLKTVNKSTYEIMTTS